MESALKVIATELKRRHVASNRSRLSSGVGRSQTFGVVNRRCLPNDYSARCFKRPYLYKLLLDFGMGFITTPFNAITVNQNYQCGPHRDRGNSGVSTLVAFGDFDGGELRIHDDESGLKGDHCVKNRLFVCDFSAMTHSVTPFTGTRYSLVYHQTPTDVDLPPPSVRFDGKKWVFYRGEEGITHGLSDNPRRKGFKERYATQSHDGLPYPLAILIPQADRKVGGEYMMGDTVRIWNGHRLKRKKPTPTTRTKNIV